MSAPMPPPADEAADDAATIPSQRRQIRSFVLRRGRVTRAQRRAYEELFPRLAIAYQPEPIDLVAAFGRCAPTVLEIGFGMGDATATIAQTRPDVNFLGVEVFAAGIGALARRIDELNLANVRIVEHDATEVVRDMIAPDSLVGVHVFFPDPWPKSRHHKRRLIAPPFVRLLAGRLAPGGFLHCATDWRNYAEQMLAVLSEETQLRSLHADYAPSPANPLVMRPPSKFHVRGARLGHSAWDLVFTRR